MHESSSTFTLDDRASGGSAAMRLLACAIVLQNLLLDNLNVAIQGRSLQHVHELFFRQGEGRPERDRYRSGSLRLIVDDLLEVSI